MASSSQQNGLSHRHKGCGAYCNTTDADGRPYKAALTLHGHVIQANNTMEKTELGKILEKNENRRRKEKSQPTVFI
jgi:hypothetical protein